MPNGQLHQSHSYKVPDRRPYNENYENDSDLGDELAIDESENLLSGKQGDGETILSNNTAMAHILAGYGTDICEQLISEFV